ncbi:MAG: hypothetical protein KDD11_19200 [Acidobacteria bacterium]|nr:hypothetical protein [Acidobacteriota bacterium]
MKILLVVLSLALGMAPAVLAEDGGQGADAVTVAAADGCSSGIAAELDLGPASDVQPKIQCPASFCSSDAQCASACPSAQSAVCSGGVCQYTYSGGGGGGGGPACPQAFCRFISDCWNVCPQANGVSCLGNVCQYW